MLSKTFVRARRTAQSVTTLVAGARRAPFSPSCAAHVMSEKYYVTVRVGVTCARATERMLLAHQAEELAALKREEDHAPDDVAIVVAQEAT
jgi:hypothetical protein